MDELQELTVPPTELEVAEVMSAASRSLTPAAMMVLRRLAFQHGTFRVALEGLAKLGNGDHYGNSIGNEIAQRALGIDRH